MGAAVREARGGIRESGWQPEPTHRAWPGGGDRRGIPGDPGAIATTPRGGCAAEVTSDGRARKPCPVFPDRAGKPAARCATFPHEAAGSGLPALYQVR